MSTASWSFGFAESVITPAKAIHMAGFGRERYATGTIAPLLGQALAFRTPTGDTALILAADAIGFEPMTLSLIRARLGEKHGIRPENILLAPSHSHWTPGIIYRINFTCGAPSLYYTVWLEEKLLHLADQALADLTPGTLDYHDAQAQIGCNRRNIDPQTGYVAFAPNPAGHYDTHTPVLSIARPTHAAVRKLILVAHACHPTSTGPVDLWSPDYPGAMRDRFIERLGEDTRALFLMGPGANAKVTHADPETGAAQFTASPQGAKEAGSRLADTVLEWLANHPAVPIPPKFQAGTATAQLPIARWKTDAELAQLFINPQDARPADVSFARQAIAYPDARTHHNYTITGWKLGDTLTLIAMPDEVCSPWGPRARALAKTPHAMLTGYANHVQCYIPDEQIRQEGGYEGESSHRAFFMPGPFAPGFDPLIQTALQQTIETLENA